jgi:hypothetical protein
MERAKTVCVRNIKSTTEMLKLSISLGLLQTTLYIASPGRLKSVVFVHNKQV